MNDALWTLKIEVLFYLSVPLMVLAMRQFGYLRVLVALYAFSAVYFQAFALLAQRSGNAGFYVEMQRQLPGQLAYFVAGAFGYYYLAEFRKFTWQLVAMAFLAYALQLWLPWSLVELTLAVLIIFAACVAPCLGNFGKYGDFSYGIYILHFPLLQTMVSMGWFRGNAVLMIFVASALLLLMAVVLWKVVEQPWLQRTSHYRSVAHAAE